MARVPVTKLRWERMGQNTSALINARRRGEDLLRPLANAYPSALACADTWGRLPAHYLAATPNASCVTPTMLQLVGRAGFARDHRGLTPLQLLAENGCVSAAQLQALAVPAPALISTRE